MNAQLTNDCRTGWFLKASKVLLLSCHSQDASRAAQHLLRRHGAGAGRDPLQGTNVDLLHIHVLLAAPASALRLRHLNTDLVQSADPLMPSKRAHYSQ